MYRIIGLFNGLKLFYLAADSASEAIAAAAVVRADAYVKPTGSEKLQDERIKSGILLSIMRLIRDVF